MNLRTTTVLLVLFFGGLIGLWWADYAKIPTEARQRQLSGRVLPELLEVPVGDITGVEIDRGGDRLVFRRTADGWQMTSPVSALADRSVLDALVGNLKGLRRIPEAETIRGAGDAFGLDRPVATIRVFISTCRTAW